MLQGTRQDEEAYRQAEASRPDEWAELLWSNFLLLSWCLILCSSSPKWMGPLESIFLFCKTDLASLHFHWSSLVSYSVGRKIKQRKLGRCNSSCKALSNTKLWDELMPSMAVTTKSKIIGKWFCICLFVFDSHLILLSLNRLVNSGST